jgi:2-haloacid dehalogenase
MIDFSRFEVLTFDCYGTLIDWEEGIASAVGGLLETKGARLPAEEILERYARAESELEAGPYLPYREVLRRLLDRLARGMGIVLGPRELDVLPDSLPRWKPFPDTVPALRAFRRRFRLGVISNIDDDLFARTAERLEVPFDWVVTAQEVGSYKPALDNFAHAIEKIGVLPERILHVAQSLYHDIEPARRMALANVWVNRRAGKLRSGATPDASARPDLEVGSLARLVELMGLEGKGAGGAGE